MDNNHKHPVDKGAGAGNEREVQESDSIDVRMMNVFVSKQTRRISSQWHCHSIGNKSLRPSIARSRVTLMGYVE